MTINEEVRKQLTDPIKLLHKWGGGFEDYNEASLVSEPVRVPNGTLPTVPKLTERDSCGRHYETPYLTKYLTRVV